MIVGATGAGKSSTINALFNCGLEIEIEDEEEDYVEFAKVGSKADPETKDIEKYTLGKLVLWDTPGLGDGTELDEHHKEIIQELLREEDEDGNALIDLVLVILDGSTKDLGTSYKILNEVIIPELGAENGRILVALNQADIAMKTGQHWNYEENEPDEILTQFLEEKLISITKRIEMDSKLLINPVYYCAGYKEENGETVHPYNLSKLLYYILNSIPSHKRIAIMESINTNSDNYEYNDEDIDYGEAVSYSFMDSFEYLFSTGIDMGAEKGRELLGIPGAVIGGLIGGTVGCIKGLINKIFK
jgi:predicted GTPase